MYHPSLIRKRSDLCQACERAPGRSSLGTTHRETRDHRPHLPSHGGTPSIQATTCPNSHRAGPSDRGGLCLVTIRCAPKETRSDRKTASLYRCEHGLTQHQVEPDTAGGGSQVPGRHGKRKSAQVQMCHISTNDRGRDSVNKLRGFIS